MKKLILISLVIIHLFSCNKDSQQPELQYLDHIVAGKTEGLGIIYSGIINDTLSFNYPQTDTTIYIDINDNGINDFKLKYRCGASPGSFRTYSVISPLENSFIAIPNGSESYIADIISFNEIIDNELDWVNEVCTLYYAYDSVNDEFSSVGLWNEVSNKYIGTKILVEDKILFGWIRVEIYRGWRLSLIDYSCTVGYELE